MATTSQKEKRNLLDGLVKQNIILMSGLVTASVITAATTFNTAFVICVAFTIITFSTIAICSLIPRKIVYTLRVIAYALVASIVYIPVYLMLNYFFKAEVEMIGIYLPILVTNALILSKTESRFYLRDTKTMFVDVIVFILGYDMVCMIVGIIREFFAENRIGVIDLYTGFTIPSLKTTFGGFLLLGILAGLWRGLYNFYKKRKILKLRAVMQGLQHEDTAVKEG